MGVGVGGKGVGVGVGGKGEGVTVMPMVGLAGTAGVLPKLQVVPLLYSHE